MQHLSRVIGTLTGRGMGNKSSSQVAPDNSETALANESLDRDVSNSSGDESDTIAARSKVMTIESEMLSRNGPTDTTPPGNVQLGKRKRSSERRNRESSDTNSEEQDSNDEAARYVSPVLGSRQQFSSPPQVFNSADFAEDQSSDDQEVGCGKLGESPASANKVCISQSKTGTNEANMNRGLPKLNKRSAKTRWPCPLANTYDCEGTFASESIAQRHKQIHLARQSFLCQVCAKTYSRSDHLKSHMLKHSKQEIDDASRRSDDRQITASSEHSNNDSSEDVTDQGPHPDGLPSTQEVPDTVLKPNTLGERAVSEGAEEASESSSASAAGTGDGDENEASEIVKETPRPQSRLKRKSAMKDPSEASSVSGDAVQKRRKRNSLSPPSSSDELDSEVAPPSGMEKSNSTSTNTTQTGLLRTGNLDNFAMPWTPGSHLRHPIHNPRSPRKPTNQTLQVNIPSSSSAGPSTSRNRSKQNHVRNGEVIPNSVALSDTPSTTIYSSPKGKRRAEPGVSYLSPPRTGDNQSNSEGLEPRGMATTIARRGTTHSTLHDAVASKKSTPKSTSIPQKSQAGSTDHICYKCQQRYSDRSGLRKHNKKMHDVPPRVPASQAMKSQKDTDEDGRKGAFSPTEIRKLNKWREYLLSDLDINLATFNQMMTDTCRRQKDFRWPYTQITKAELLRDYYEVLPGRDRRSMHRYRERAFQNVPEHQEWTAADDAELIRLVEEIGPKWVEIGQLMTRTQDSVNQRWRMKLQHRRDHNVGEWERSEVKKLKEAVTQVKRSLNLSLDPLADLPIPWDLVSKKLKGIRTPQQCSNKWRLMHQVRRGNTFFKASELSSQEPSPSPSTTTPSKMSLRLSGQVDSTPNKKSRGTKSFLSEKYVHDSDEAGDVNNQAEVSGDEDGEEDNSSENKDNDNADEADSGSDEDDEDDRNNTLGERARPQSSSSSSSERDSESSPELAPVDDTSKTPYKAQKQTSTRTPQTSAGLSQLFEQTQANTSAIRAPATTRKVLTQPDLPTPGVSIQYRPISSSWQAVNMQPIIFPVQEISPPVNTAIESNSDSEDDMMAESKSSDDDGEAQDQSSEEASDDSSEESGSGDSGESDTGDKQSDEDDEESNTSSGSDIAHGSPESKDRRQRLTKRPMESSVSEEASSEDESFDKVMHKNNFIATLSSSASTKNTNSALGVVGTAGKNRKRPNLMSSLQAARAGLQVDEEDEDSDSSDGDDIPHHPVG